MNNIASSYCPVFRVACCSARFLKECKFRVDFLQDARLSYSECLFHLLWEELAKPLHGLYIHLSVQKKKN